MMDVVLHFTDEQLEQLKILAEQRGFESIEAYVISLIVRDARKRLEEISQNGHSSSPKPQPAPEPPPDSLEANFQQAMRNVMRNQSKPRDSWREPDGD